MSAFAYTLEREDGTPADPQDSRTGLERRRYEPVGAREDAPRARDPAGEGRGG